MWLYAIIAHMCENIPHSLLDGFLVGRSPTFAYWLKVGHQTRAVFVQTCNLSMNLTCHTISIDEYLCKLSVERFNNLIHCQLPRIIIASGVVSIFQALDNPDAEDVAMMWRRLLEDYQSSVDSQDIGNSL